VYNDGVPSGSNDRIVRTTMKFIASWLKCDLPRSGLLVVIGWTHPSRREWYVDGAFRQTLPTHGYSLRGLNRIVSAYRRYGVSRDDQQWRFATQVLGLGGFLSTHDIAYRFFHAIEATAVPAVLSVPAVCAPLRSPNFVCPDSSMVQYLKTVPGSTRVQHPSEAGHLAWARFLSQATPAQTISTTSIPDIIAAGLPLLGGSRVTMRLDRKSSDHSRIRQWRAARQARSERFATDQFIYP